MPVDVGVTLDPDVIGSEDEWRTFVAEVGELGEELHVYNHALMGEAHLDWLNAAVVKPEN
ncbi:hypothetical protein [Haladaptatus sp. R4]|uniref:hypothetical protein n=2 Tax=Haladaptatus TaxID=367188 RepID=UPI000A9E760F|nr:hypothetical protein [Haladaptatus sp. R4]